MAGGGLGVVEAVVRAACAAVHFHALPAEGAKFVKQVAPCGGGEVVAHGVGDDGDAACFLDGGDGVAQLCPLVAYRRAFALAQIAGEGLLFGAGVPLLHQPVGDVGARDHFGVGGKGERAFGCACDAVFGEFGGDLVQACYAPLSHLGEQGLQAVVVFVKVQRNDVEGAVSPCYGDFRAVDESDTVPRGFGAGFGKPACVVVVGEGEQAAAVLCGGLHQLRRRECAIGYGGMGVEVYHFAYSVSGCRNRFYIVNQAITLYSRDKVLYDGAAGFLRNILNKRCFSEIWQGFYNN